MFAHRYKLHHLGVVVASLGEFTGRALAPDLVVALAPVDDEEGWNFAAKP